MNFKYLNLGLLFTFTLIFSSCIKIPDVPLFQKTSEKSIEIGIGIKNEKTGTGKEEVLVNTGEKIEEEVEEILVNTGEKIEEKVKKDIKKEVKIKKPTKILINSGKTLEEEKAKTSTGETRKEVELPADIGYDFGSKKKLLEEKNEEKKSGTGENK